MDVLFRDLSLRLRNFFNKDPGHWIPACLGVITSTVSGTISDPESHAHLAFVDVIAVTLNIVDAVNILTLCLPHVHKTVNWQRGCTFSTVESEIPAFAATVTASNTKYTSPVNMKGCVREFLSENAVLEKNRNYLTIPNCSTDYAILISKLQLLSRVILSVLNKRKMKTHTLISPLSLSSFKFFHAHSFQFL